MPQQGIAGSGLTAAEIQAMYPGISSQHIGLDAGMTQAQVEQDLGQPTKKPPPTTPTMGVSQNNKVTNDPGAAGPSASVDPIANKLQNASKQYQASMPSIIDSETANAANNSRLQLAQGLTGNNASYNQRGLLYSGLRAGGANDVANQTANNLATTKAGINQSVANNAAGLAGAAANAGQVQTGINQQQTDLQNQYQQAILQALLQQSQGNLSNVFAGLGGAGNLVGSAAGGLLGSGKSNSSTPYTDYYMNL